MKEIATIAEAEDFIFNYNWYESKSGNPEDEYRKLKICEQLGVLHHHSRLLCRTRVYLTSYYTQVNDLQAALETGLPNLEVAFRENWVDEYLKNLSFLITIYQLLGNYPQAEVYINLCKDYVYQLNDVQKICNIHIVSANQYFYTGDLEKCIESHKTALKYATELQDKYSLLTIYNNYGFHLIESDPEESYRILRKGLELLETDPVSDNRTDYLLAYFHQNLAVLYNKLDQNEACIGSARRAVDLFSGHQLAVEKLDAQIILARGLLNSGDYESCLDVLREIEHTAAASSAFRILLKCYKIFYECYEKTASYQDAFRYMKLFMQINEQIYNEESSQKIRNLQITHEVKTIRTERENAENMARLKHDFLANMSHEIRTPVNSILGICYLLQRDAVSEKQADYLERLQRSGEQLLGIINDVLDISKIEAGKLELNKQALNVSRHCRDLIAQLSVKARDKGISLELRTDTEIPDCLTGDPVRVNQVLSNLLSNAIKFTEDGGVFMELRRLNSDDQRVWVEFLVRDTGIGMSKEILQRIFERYEQASASTHIRFGGTGLGLAISQKLVDMMHGTIQVESQMGKGTEFRVKIPFDVSSDVIIETDTEAVDPKMLNGKYLLIADDVAENRQLFIDILARFSNHIRIAEATNGQEVLDMLRMEMPDLLLLDLDMPVKNGFETITEIRNNFPSNKPGVIAHTASLLTISEEELLELGFDGLLQKPFLPQHMMNTLASVLSKQGT